LSAPTYAVIDQGNTLLKLGLFRDGVLIRTEIFSDPLNVQIAELIQENKVKALMYSSVADTLIKTPDIPDECQLIKFHSALKLPLEIGYQKDEVMGSDRIAAAAGLSTYNGPLCVAIDFGTCTTLTVVNHNVIVNDSISPGRWMRYRALHEFTGRLPLLIPPAEVAKKSAQTTEDTIHQGVSVASALEIEHLLHYLLDGKLPDSLVITGGDHPFFERHLKTPNFADPHLVLKGLHAILLENI